MRTQRHPGRARWQFVIVAATATALLVTGGLAHAAAPTAEAPTSLFTFDTPDVPAGGTVTHTFKVNATEKGQVEVYMEPGQGFRWWDVESEASGYTVSNIDGGTNAKCEPFVYDNGERQVNCDVGAGESIIKYSLTAKADMEAWGIEAQASFKPTAGTETTKALSNFSVLSANPVEMSYRVFGRDTAGRLHSHETLPVQIEPLLDYWRQDHGSGWNAFNAVTKLSPIGMDNRGGGVVAREPSGLLWFYPTSGKKWSETVFKPRVRVGTGWDTYNSIRGTGDVTNDGHADLIARDKTGVLWLYEGTGVEAKPFAARTKVGSGWGVYNAMTGGVDSTKDGIADLYARDTSGFLWFYEGTGNPASPYAQRRNLGSHWDKYTALIAPGDGSPIGKGGLLARDKAGKLWWYQGTGNRSGPLEGPAAAVAETHPYTAWF